MEAPAYPKKYCSHCGREMNAILRGAEENLMYYGTDSTGPFDTAYDEETGRRQYCLYYTCPLWKKICWGLFYSPHDEYFIDKIYPI